MIMSNIFRKLIAAYKRHGYSIRSGLNPYYLSDPDEAFTLLYRHGKAVSTGGGLAPIEVLFLEELLNALPDVRRILVIGNAYGWSTLALSMAKPEAKVVAIDAAIEGTDARHGKHLTELIAREDDLNVTVVEALSPRDVESVVNRHLDGSVDFALIDGLHVNEQLIRDFDAVSSIASPDCVYFLHDILNWHMLEGLRDISKRTDVHSFKILTRLTSGPAIVFGTSPTGEVTAIADDYVDDTFDPYQFIQQQNGSLEEPGPLLAQKLSKGFRFRALGIAATHLAEGDRRACLQTLQQFVSIMPDDSQQSFRAGAFLLDSGLAAEAIFYFEQASKLNPAWSDPIHQMGRASHALGDLAGARHFFNRAMALSPEWAPPHLSAAQVAAESGDHAIANECFGRALALSPDWPEAHFEYALFQLRSGHLHMAAQHLQRVIILAPDWKEAHIEFAQLSILQNEFQTALTHCIEAQLLAPNERLFIWNGLEITLRKQLDMPAIITVLSSASATYPSMRILWKLQGLALRQAGSPAKALDSFKQALVLVPDWPSVLYELGVTYRDMGDHAAARQYLKRAAEVRPELEGLNQAIQSLRELQK